MRIAYLVHFFPKLSETFVLNQITGLLDAGHDVRIYALADAGEAEHPDVQRYQLRDRTTYFTPLPRGRKTRWRSAWKLLRQELQRRPARALRAIGLGRRAWARAIDGPWGALGLVAPIPEPLEFDIIHCHFGYNGLRGLLLKEMGLFHGKLVITFHAVDLTVFLNEFGDSIYSELFQKADLLLPISYYWREKLIALGAQAKSVHVHRMGIDCQRFVLQPRHWQPGDPLRLLSVARLTEKKGIEYAILAVAQVVQRFPELPLEYTIIGDGPLRPELERLIKELQVGPKVTLAGWRMQTEVAEALSQAHIFLAPSVTAADGDQEGIPVVLMEALAEGLPVLSTFHSGIGELVEDGVSGHLVDERDVEGLTEKLVELINHPERWQSLGLAGRRKVEREFAIDQLNEQLIELFEQLVAPKEPSHFS